MFIKNICVHLKKNSYLINIGYKVFCQNKLFPPFKKGDRVVLVTNSVVEKIWKNSVLNYFLNNNLIVDEFIFADGEDHKNLNSVDELLNFLLKNMHTRNTILVALGGGVIGDLVGFVASIYQRGIHFIQIPTTLLSQVDAAIGGKTGVNHKYGKNMIGSFWQPKSVIINIDFLYTLPYNQLIFGFSEIIKYAISFDYVFFNWLKFNIYKVLSLDFNSLLYCIEKCCELKARIVTLDEKEKNDRMLLNFGHTYAHAIESYFKYSSWSHGQAVSVGMVMAVRTSEKLGILSVKDACCIIDLIQHCGLPIFPPKEMCCEDYLKYMIRDKKNCFGKINLILPTSIGKVKLFENIDRNIIFSVIQSFNN